MTLLGTENLELSLGYDNFLWYYEMVLPNHNQLPILQANLGFQDTQEDIVSNLNTCA